jgi:hypothetical protein
MNSDDVGFYVEDWSMGWEADAGRHCVSIEEPPMLYMFGIKLNRIYLVNSNFICADPCATEFMYVSSFDQPRSALHQPYSGASTSHLQLVVQSQA